MNAATLQVAQALVERYQGRTEALMADLDGLIYDALFDAESGFSYRDVRIQDVAAVVRRQITQIGDNGDDNSGTTDSTNRC